MMITENEGLEGKIKRRLISPDKIRKAVKSEGLRISREYKGKPLLILSILSGSFIFASDLCREITVPCKIAFMKADSYYDGGKSSGQVNITLDITEDLSKYHVLIAEDIVDTGRTLKLITSCLKERNPLSLEVVTLLDKPECREVSFKPDRALFTIPNLFVVGYGLDYGGYFRNLPYIAEYATDGQ